MNYQGYAFTEGEKEEQQKIRDRFKEIEEIKGVEFGKEPCYGHTNFRGKVTTDEARELSEMDLLIIADHGNLCFGGNCSKSGDNFSGSYNTD